MTKHKKGMTMKSSNSKYKTMMGMHSAPHYAKGKGYMDGYMKGNMNGGNGGMYMKKRIMWGYKG